MSGYVICTTARSGSNHLCQLLSSTGLLGHPLEYFHAERRRSGPSYPNDADIEQILKVAATPNGIFGIKMMPNQIDRIAANRWADRLPPLGFIHLTRGDLLSQAISLARAVQTGQWRSDRPAPNRNAQYDAAEIGRCLRTLAKEDARWRLFFARNGLQPLRLEYEDDLLADPQRCVDEIAAYVGVSGPTQIDWSKTPLSIQRDEHTAAWRNRFVDEFRDINPLDRVTGFGLGEMKALMRVIRRTVLRRP